MCERIFVHTYACSYEQSRATARGNFLKLNLNFAHFLVMRQQIVYIRKMKTLRKLRFMGSDSDSFIIRGCGSDYESRNFCKYEHRLNCSVKAKQVGTFRSPNNLQPIKVSLIEIISSPLPNFPWANSFLLPENRAVLSWLRPADVAMEVFVWQIASKLDKPELSN